MPTAPRPPQAPFSLRHHATYFLSRYLAYWLPLLFFFVTASFYLKTYDSAQVKITFTQIGTLVLAIAWVARYAVEGRWPFSKADLVYIAPILAFLVSGLVSFAHSPFKMWAMEETSRRVFYMLIALVTVSELKSVERTARLWRWLFAAAWVILLYALVQYIDSRFFPATQFSKGIDPFIWRQAFGFRVFSTFGNPNFFGNFLVIFTAMIFATVLKGKGPLTRPFIVVAVMAALAIAVDRLMGVSGTGASRVLWLAVVIASLTGLGAAVFWKSGGAEGQDFSSHLLLFALLFLSLYSTETKGAWVGFMAATSITLLLIMEYFLHLDDELVPPRRYMAAMGVLTALFGALLTVMAIAFVMPFFRGTVEQIGFQILWIPCLAAALATFVALAWAFRKPWNLKKLIYTGILFFVLSVGAGVLQFATQRLTSVSFRLFTWISTWEMVRTEPILGNGVGTFKVIYPAFRRPEIIVLENKSNTETDHAEDEYLEVWQDEGIVGFGIFLWFVLTAVVCGLKQLRWYSHVKTASGKRRRLLDMESDPRSYEVLGFLGGFLGALVHWAVDVSVRFVSSGVFMGLLPGALIAYARHQAAPITEEVRLPYERMVRVAVAATWTAIFLFLRMELIPPGLDAPETTTGQIWFYAILTGLILFLFMEAIEFRRPAPTREVPFSEQYLVEPAKAWPARALLVSVVVGACIFGMQVSRGHFLADVHHNIAIFFSKEGIWNREPRFNNKVLSYPIDLRNKYRDYGGALENYHRVIMLNPAFPMASYFVGNVYNDWGSGENSASVAAKARGDSFEAERLRDKAREMWDKSEEAYARTRRLAPNYVQMHHQMGSLYSKRAEQSEQWGDGAAAAQFYEKALGYLRLYHLLDPVFPPNYDRMAQILLRDKKFDEVIALYGKAIYYNQDVSMRIHRNFNEDRVTSLKTSLGKVYYMKALSLAPDPFKPVLPEVLKSVEAFEGAVAAKKTNAEAWRNLSFLYQRMGREADARAAAAAANGVPPQPAAPTGSFYE